MNEKLQYASMLEIPVNTCNITYKPIKRKKEKRKKTPVEDVKTELISKVNLAVDNQEEVFTEKLESEKVIEQLDFNDQIDNQVIEEQVVFKKPKKKFNFLTAQFLVIGGLIATIAITSIANTNSGLNNFFKSVFGGGSAVVETLDDRTYMDFAPVINMDNLNGEQIDGVMSFAGADSAYACADGVVKSLTQGEDGKFTMEIAHSNNFVSVFKGLLYAYANVGDIVYGNIPVGYYKDGLQMCFNGQDGSVICDYEVIDGSVVWAV